MKAVFGKKRFKTAMVIIAAMVVVAMGSVVEPVEVRAAGPNVIADKQNIEVTFVEGETNTEQNITLTNNEATEQTITAPASSDDWNISAPTKIDASSTATIKLTLNNTSAQNHNTSFVITIGDSEPQTTININVNCEVRPKTYEMTLNQNTVNFPTKNEGYLDFEPTSIKVTNNGNSPFKLMSVVSNLGSSSNYTIADLDTTSEIAVGETSTFKIKPTYGSSGLPAETYSETFTIKNDKGDSYDKDLTVSFTVTPNYVTSIDITSSTHDITKNIKTGESVTLAADINDNATDKTLNWTISPTIATITPSQTTSDSATVMVTGSNAGQVTITATAADEGEFSKSQTIKFIVPTTSISITPTDDRTIAIGETIQFSASQEPQNATPQSFVWEVNKLSGENNPITVDQSGRVTGNSAGIAQVIAKISEGDNAGTERNGFSGNITVDANKAYITTDSPLPAGTVGKTYSTTLTAKGSDIKWSWKAVGNGSLPPGLDISSDGKITGTPKTAGTYTVDITATGTGTNNSNTKRFTITIGGTSETGGTVEYNKGDNEITAVTASGIPAGQRVVVKSYGSTDKITDHHSSLLEEAKKKFAGVKADELKTHFLDIDLYQGLTEVSTSQSVIRVKLATNFSDFWLPVLVYRYHGGVQRLALNTTKNGPFNDAQYSINDMTPQGGGYISIFSSRFSPYMIVYPTVATVTVNFETNGGTDVDSIFVKAGGTILTMPTNPTRTGYTFEGWYLDPNFTTKVTSSTQFNNNATLYARWTSGSSTGNTTNSGNSGTTNRSTTTGGTGTGNNPSGTTPVNAPQTGDPIDYVRAFAAMIVICAGTLVLLYTLKARRRK